MDVGQSNHAASTSQNSTKMFRPFARPRKRRRIVPSKPTTISVRPNPPNYSLNFTDGDSPERNLLNHVLSAKRMLSLVGLPGCGKSVIMRGLAYHPSISSTFRDGIYLIQLDKNPPVDIKTFLLNLHEVVSCLCGNDPTGVSVPGMVAPNAVSALEGIKALINEGGVEARHRIVDHILAVMRDKRFLLMFDHVSSSHAEIFDIIIRLSDGAPRSRRFTFLCSTRSHDVARQIESLAIVVSLQDPTGNASRDILCSHAGFERAQFDLACNRDGTAIMSVLRKCSGLALALAVAGGAVKRLLESTKPVHIKGLIWKHYEAYLCNSFDQFGQISGLFASLSSVVVSVERDKSWRCPLSVWDAFCSLSAIRHNVWLPYPILQRLWDMKKKDDVISVVRPFANACLISRERRGTAVGIVVPSFILGYSCFEAAQRGKTRQPHVCILKSYADQLSALSSARSLGKVGSGEEIHYLKEHIQHHVAMAIERADKSELESNNRIITQGLSVIQQYFFKMTPDNLPPQTATFEAQPDVLVIEPEPEPEPESETKQVPKAGSKPVLKSDVPLQKADPKSVLQDDDVPLLKPDRKSVLKLDAELTSKFDLKTGQKTEQKPRQKPDQIPKQSIHIVKPAPAPASSALVRPSPASAAVPTLTTSAQSLRIPTTQSNNAAAHLVGVSNDPKQRQVVIDAGVVAENKPAAANGLNEVIYIVGD